MSNDSTSGETEEKETEEHAEAPAHGAQGARECGGWQLRFEKVHDCLAVYANNGGMISWPDRGKNGQFTWHASDPVGETRSISPWAGDGDEIFLYAKITQDGTTGDHQCDMNTLYNGVSKKRWEFDEDEYHSITR